MYPYLSHRIHLWYICLHEWLNFHGKCRYIHILIYQSHWSDGIGKDTSLSFCWCPKQPLAKCLFQLKWFPGTTPPPTQDAGKTSPPGLWGNPNLNFLCVTGILGGGVERNDELNYLIFIWKMARVQVDATYPYLEPDGHPFINGCFNWMINQICTWKNGWKSPCPSIKNFGSAWSLRYSMLQLSSMQGSRHHRGTLLSQCQVPQLHGIHG